jgi:hypothetical protein
MQQWRLLQTLPQSAMWKFVIAVSRARRFALSEKRMGRTDCGRESSTEHARINNNEVGCGVCMKDELYSIIKARVGTCIGRGPDPICRSHLNFILFVRSVNLLAGRVANLRAFHIWIHQLHWIFTNVSARLLILKVRSQEPILWHSINNLIPVN